MFRQGVKIEGLKGSKAGQAQSIPAVSRKGCQRFECARTKLKFEHGCAWGKDMQPLALASKLNTSESKGSIQQSTVGLGIPSSQGSLIERPVIITIIRM